MSKTIVGTQADKSPLWQAWSEAVAFAESRIGEYNENAAWAKVDKLWEQYTMSREVNRAYYLYRNCRQSLGKAINTVYSELKEQNDFNDAFQPAHGKDELCGAGW